MSVRICSGSPYYLKISENTGLVSAALGEYIPMVTNRYRIGDRQRVAVLLIVKSELFPESYSLLYAAPVRFQRCRSRRRLHSF